MFIFHHINFTCDAPNFKGKYINIPQGGMIHLNSFFMHAINISYIKNKEGDRPNFSFTFKGDINVKIGISRCGYSFTWVYEQKFCATEWSRENIQLNLADFVDGNLEITIFGLQESVLLTEDDLPNNQKAIESVINAKNVLYDFISPSLDLCSEEQIYYKFNHSAYFSFEDRYIHFGENTCADLLTYFNAFSACKWAKYTNIKNISIYIDFIGKADIILVHKDEIREHNLCCYSIDTTKRATFELPVGTYPSTGILGIRIFAYDRSTLFGGGWLSPDPETQSVMLGIGITTFKREKAVKAAIQRLNKAITTHPLYSTSISITVIDNGQTLSPDDVKGATLIPNKNLGGTGGFTRSLIHYQDDHKYTHCLFMDDDARCEASTIFRSMSFMRHVTLHNIALSGAMLFENIQFLQWENGAWFDGGCHPLKHGLDLRNIDHLIENEQESEKNIYGAWWFFFFPITEAKNYSLPFFVRGDDIDFSYSNKFKIVSFNGISCWQQDFKTKENAMTVYLFIRSHIVHHLTIPSLECTPKKIITMLWKHFRNYNNSYMYGTAASLNLAISHVLKGPIFWEQNIEPVDILKKIKEISKYEQPTPYTDKDQKKFIFADKNIKTRILPAFLRKISLNGHLLPKKMIKHTPNAMIYKNMMPNANRIYMRDQINIVNNLTNEKITLKLNSSFYIKNLINFIILSTKLWIRYLQLSKIYTLRAKIQRTRDFWKKCFI